MFSMETLATSITPKQRQLCGQLYKYTNVMKGWQYRYFVVDANAGQLHYFLCDSSLSSAFSAAASPSANEQQLQFHTTTTTPNSTISEQPPRGTVHLAGALICPSEEDSRTFSVHCTNGDMLKLRATDARARQEWVNGLRAVAESHTKTSGGPGGNHGLSPPTLPPREHLAVMEAMANVRLQLQATERADTGLWRSIEASGPVLSIEPDLLLLKATSAAALHCLNQCAHMLQRGQHALQAPTGLVMDHEWNVIAGLNKAFSG